MNASVVRSVVRQAAARSGLASRLHGPHRLRHSVATRLLDGGATLKEIADVLRRERYQRRAFARFVNEQRETGVLTMELLLRWVQSASTPGPVTAARRVEVLRPFLKYCRQFDPTCPVIPLEHCGRGHRRLAPHIYMEAEVEDLLAAACELKPEGLRPLTYATLFGLLAATGLRLSEALGLERRDLNLENPSLTVRQTKFKKSRLVPIHVSTARALADYQKAVLGTLCQSGNECVFLSREGLPISKRTVSNTFERLRHRAFTICTTRLSVRHYFAASGKTGLITLLTPSRHTLGTRKFPAHIGISRLRRR